MANLEIHPTHEPVLGSAVRASSAAGMAEGVTAIAAVVLSILGLAGALTMFMLAVSCIVIGAALLFEGGSSAGRFSRLQSLHGEIQTEKAELEGGIAAEAMAGAAGLVLGILSLVGIAPTTLCPVAAIVFGAGILFGSGASAQLNRRAPAAAAGMETRIARDVREAVFLSAGGELLVGVAAVVLGILGLLDMAPATLTLVAFLGLGVALVLSGTAVGAKMFGVLKHG